MDLEASAMTKRAARAADGPAVGAQQAAPAAYVRAVSLAVERLEQTYMRAADEASGQRYDYAAPLRVRLRGPLWSTTSLAWCSTTQGSPSVSADRPEMTSLARDSARSAGHAIRRTARSSCERSDARALSVPRPSVTIGGVRRSFHSNEAMPLPVVRAMVRGVRGLVRSSDSGIGGKK